MSALLARVAIVLLVPSAEPGDLAGWEEAARRVTLEGIPAAYASFDPGSLYPPAFFYPLGLIGHAYRACCSASFELGTPSLDVLMRLGPSIVDALLACLVYALVRVYADAGRALLAGLLYAGCPAVLVTVAQRGMIGDPYIGALAVLAVLCACRGWSVPAAATITLAVLVKPQALVLVPCVAWLIRRGAPASRQVAALLAAGLVALLVLLPFGLHGTLGSVWLAAREMANLHAYTQNSADNVWTLLPVWRSGGAEVGSFGEVPDATPLVAGLSYRDVGLLVVAVLQVLVLARLGARPGPRQVVLASAGLVLAFFFFSTRMHVNYGFLAFPFLCALAATGGWRGALALAAATLACLVDWQTDLPWAVHRANAALYAATLALVLGMLLVNARLAWPAIGRLPRRRPWATVARGRRAA